MTAEQKYIQDQKQILSRFTNHIPDKDTINQMALMRTKIRELAQHIDLVCPDSREKMTALTQLSFVMMSANSAIVQACPINISELTERERVFLDSAEG